MIIGSLMKEIVATQFYSPTTTSSPVFGITITWEDENGKVTVYQ